MKEADLFCQALDRSLEERGEFLRDACGGDEMLRKKVEALLHEHENGEGMLDEPVESLEDASVHEPPSAGESIAEDGTRILYFGDYQLKGEIARGAMGVVYRAFQQSLKREVAVKMIRSAMLANDGDVARFRSEAEAAGSLDHPNIVPIYEVGEFEGQHYFSMKLIEGDTLREHLDELKNDPRVAAKLVAIVARATHSAHQRGILHRDLKPGNILIDAQGDPHVTDFGLAKEIESTSSMTLSGQIMGTPSYMAPEQAANGGKDLTTAADIYSVGAVLYEILTGVPPHKGESLMETLKLLGESEPALPEKLNSNVDRDLQTIAMKCLERDPSRRFPSTLDLAAELERWLRGEPIESRPVGNLERAIKWMKRKPVHATAAMLGVLLLLTLGIGGPMVALRQARLADEANKAREVADERAETLRAQMYSFEMIAASEETMKPDGIPKINRWNHSEHSEETDLRGWEWYYSRSVTERFVASYNTQRDLPVVEWNDEGHTLLALDGDGRLSEWEPASGRITRRWSIPSDVDWFAPIQGAEEIKMRAGRKLIRKSLRTSEEELMFDIPPIEIFGSWSRDGRYMASLQPRDPPVKNQSHLRLWGAGEDWSKAPFVKVTGDCSSPQAWSADGTRLAIATTPFGAVTVFDRRSGDLLASAPVMGRITNVQVLAWDPGDTLIALAAHDGEIQVVKAEDLSAPEGWSRVSHSGNVKALAWSPDGALLASGGDDRVIRVWEIATGKEVLSFRGHSAPIASLAWSANGHWIASGELGGEVRIWKADEDSRPALVDTDAGLSVNTLDWNPNLERVAFSANQGGGYVGGILQLPSREVMNRPGQWVKSLSWHPDGEHLAAAYLDGGEDLLKMVNPDSGEVRWGKGPGFWQVAWTPDGNIVAAMDHEGTLDLHRAEDGSVVRKIVAPLGDQRTERPTRQFQFSPNGETLAWGQKTGRIALIDPANGILQRELDGHAARVAGVDWTRDGMRIASASEDHTARIWDISSGEATVMLIGHSASVIDVRWSPGESRLATASLDGTVRLWNPDTGNEVARFPCPGPMRSVVWSPDGARLVAGGESVILLFDARAGYRTEERRHFERCVEKGEWGTAATHAREILDRFTAEGEASWLHSGWWHRQTAKSESTPSSSVFIGAGEEWRPCGEGCSERRLDLEQFVGASGDQATWLATRVFSAREQQVRLEVFAPGRCKTWLGNQIVIDSSDDALPGTPTAGEITLKEGWNTFTVRLLDLSEGDLLNICLFREER